jgi:hypothetical protein
MVFSHSRAGVIERGGHACSAPRPFATKLEARSPDVTAGSLMQLRHSPEWPEVRVFRVVTSDNTGAIVSVECDAETSYRTGERMTASHKLKEEFPCHKPLLAKVT